ncbi:hypothetical protein BDZ91DRAFT_721938 [Kalaharituber pfeilii]|nr:hypothetical protein BDZ91DRAFT_721938 [Kalaharituber pfeilii]
MKYPIAVRISVLAAVVVGQSFGEALVYRPPSIHNIAQLQGRRISSTQPCSSLPVALFHLTSAPAPPPPRGQLPTAMNLAVPCHSPSGGTQTSRSIAHVALASRQQKLKRQSVILYAWRGRAHKEDGT